MRSLGILLIVIGIGICSIPIVRNIQFDIGCGGYLKSSADACTVDLAKGELDTAIKYLDEHKLNYGYSHLIIKNRQVDVGYWYSRLVAARNDLDTITGEASNLEKSNMLMKLRETLCDEGERGTKVTLPPHIELFPYQWVICISAVLSLFVITGGFFMVFISFND